MIAQRSDNHGYGPPLPLLVVLHEPSFPFKFLKAIKKPLDVAAPGQLQFCLLCVCELARPVKIEDLRLPSATQRADVPWKRCPRRSSARDTHSPRAPLDGPPVYGHPLRA
jgi:hypothetical protein